MTRPLITLTSDFGVQSQGVGIMESVALEISPNAHVLHFMHGLPDYDVRCAARTLETLNNVQIGYHVCVVDPGVGTSRKGIIIKTQRGDYLIGPDNGVLVSASRILGGALKVVQITNPEYMRQPVSPIFHGRDVFTPAAGHLSMGVPLEEFGPTIALEELVTAPYNEAKLVGDTIEAEVIHINKYGSAHLNILHAQWDLFVEKEVSSVMAQFTQLTIALPIVVAFGDVQVHTPLILKDDYGRVAVAINQGNFSKEYKVQVGESCSIRSAPKFQN